MTRPTITPEEFERLGTELTHFLAQYLGKLPDLPTFPTGVTGKTTTEAISSSVPQEGMGKDVIRDLEEVFAMSRPNSPRFFAYVFGSGEPVAALGDFAASVLNQNLTSWRSGPAAATIERTVISWLAEAIGCAGFTGSLTGGGSSANLMGLCMAREWKLAANKNGVRSGVLYASKEVHMSIPKAAALLGLGYESVRYIDVDDSFRMRADQLRAKIREDLEWGETPFAVVATAGTVSTGSIDPLADIAQVCNEFGLWMHVDGAYGALAALAAPEKFRGLERADSLSLDPHKWLYQPADVGCLLYRDPAHAQAAFSHSGDYAKVLSADPIEGFAFFEESIELSRRFRALKLWLSLRYHGFKAFREAIAEDLRLAKCLADAVDSEPRLERLAPVELSAVCFRLADRSDEENAAVLRRIIERGRVYISNAGVGGKFALRACIVNHRATETDVRSVVSEVLEADHDLFGTG